MGSGELRSGLSLYPCDYVAARRGHEAAWVLALRFELFDAVLYRHEPVPSAAPMGPHVLPAELNCEAGLPRGGWKREAVAYFRFGDLDATAKSEFALLSAPNGSLTTLGSHLISVVR
eukprot:SAG11_NODE_11444_length_760_cov_1.261725_1_plen_117_part_10